MRSEEDASVELVVLVLGHHARPYSDNEAVQRDTWAAEARRDSRVRVFWVFADPSRDAVHQDQRGNLFVPVSTEVSEAVGNSVVLEKSIGAMIWAAERFDPNYILRTNTSSYLCLPELLAELEPLPSSGLYRGFIGTHSDQPRAEIDFVSGASMLMTRDVVARLVDVDVSSYPGLLEDVAIGAFLQEQGVEPQLAGRISLSDGEPLSYGGFVRLRAIFSDRITRQRMREVDAIFSEADPAVRASKLNQHDRREARRAYRSRIQAGRPLREWRSAAESVAAVRSLLNIHGYLSDRRHRKSTLLTRSQTFPMPTPSEASVTAEPLARPSSFPFVTGDGFRALCDRVWEEGSVAAGFLSSPSEGEAWFCKIDRADELATLVESSAAPLRPSSASLVLHNGDDVPSAQALRRLLGLFERVYAVNIADSLRREVGVDGLHAIPIGLENAHWEGAGRVELYPPPGDLVALGRWSDRPCEALGCFNPATNPAQREELSALLASSPWIDWREPVMDQGDYAATVRQARFVLSPPGNGNDCHRTWEAMYLGAIPVVLSAFLDSGLTSTLPVLAVASWDEFLSMSPEERTEAGNELLARPREMLDLAYWEQTIRRRPLERA